MEGQGKPAAGGESMDALKRRIRQLEMELEEALKENRQLMAELEKLRNQGGDGGAYKSRTAATRTVHSEAQTDPVRMEKGGPGGGPGGVVYRDGESLDSKGRPIRRGKDGEELDEHGRPRRRDGDERMSPSKEKAYREEEERAKKEGRAPRHGEVDTSALEKEIARLKAENELLKMKLAQMEKENAKLKDELAKALQMLADLEDELARLRAELDALRKRIAELEAQLGKKGG